MVKRAIIALLLVSVAWAADCGDYDVVLEIEAPPVTLAGAEFELSGEQMVFSGGACMEGDFGTLTADQISYNRQTEKLKASNVSGEVSGWRLTAPVLQGDAERMILENARLRRGDTELVAETVLLQGQEAQLAELQATTPRYRFKAARGQLQGDTFYAEEVWGTPCRCGKNLELLARRAEFAFADERLYLQRADLRAYGVDLARPEEMVLDLAQPIQLEFPFRLGYGNGWTFGVEKLPVMLPGEPFGHWSTHLTLLASGLGGSLIEGKTESFSLAIDYAKDDLTARFGLKPTRRWNGSSWDSWAEPDIFLRMAPLQLGIGWDRGTLTSTGYLLLSDTFEKGPARVAPFARFAWEPAHNGLSAGAGGDVSLPQYAAGPWSLEAKLPYLLALYPDAGPFLWGGGQVGLRYGKLFSLQAEVYRAYGAPRYSYESRTAREVLKLRAGKDGWWAAAGYHHSVRYSLADGAVSGQLVTYQVDLGWRDEWGSTSLGWKQKLIFDSDYDLLKGGETWRAGAVVEGHKVDGEWNHTWNSIGNDTRSEVWLTYLPPLADCAGGWRVSPSLGYDLLTGGFSRAGLQLEINDCCFTWQLGYLGVFDSASAGQPEGHNVTFSLRLR